jgi:hypothetical protein
MNDSADKYFYQAQSMVNPTRYYSAADYPFSVIAVLRQKRADAEGASTGSPFP